MIGAGAISAIFTCFFFFFLSPFFLVTDCDKGEGAGEGAGDGAGDGVAGDEVAVDGEGAAEGEGEVGE